MSLFSKTNKYRKPSRRIDEKVKLLDIDLERTGILSEIANSTAGLYTHTQHVPGSSGGTFDVPDTSGVTNGSSYTQAGGEGKPESGVWTDPGYSDNSDLFNSGTGGDLSDAQPILNSPWNGLNDSSGNPSGSAGFGAYPSVWGTKFVTFNSDGTASQVSDSDSSPYAEAFRAYRDAFIAAGWPSGGWLNPGWHWRAYWVPFSIWNPRIDAYWPGSGQSPEWGGIVKGSPDDGSAMALLGAYVWTGDRGKYTVPDTPPGTQVLSRNSLGDGGYFPGDIKRSKEEEEAEEKAKEQLGLGDRAWEWLNDVASNVKDKASDILDKGREFGDNLDKSIEGAIDSAIDWAQDASQDVKDWVEESIDKDSPLWEYKDAIGDGINALDNWVDDNISDPDGTKRQIFTDFGEAATNVLSEAAKDFFNYDAESAANFMNDMNQHALDMKDNPNTPGSSMDNRKDQSDRVSDSDMNALNDVVNSDEYKNEVDDYRNGTGNYENLSEDEARAKLQEELVGSEGKNGMLEQVIYDRPGLDNSLHNGVQIDIDHLEETGETKLNKTYDFNEGGSVEDAEENPYFYAYSQVMNLPADAFGTGAAGGAVALYAKFVGLSNADMYNGINEMPPMHYSVTVGSRDKNKNESFIVESKNYTPLGSSKIKKNVKEYKKTLKHGRFNLFDFMPGFDNPPPKKKVKESYITEGWQSPEHVNVDKNERKRWFNPKDIAPEFPEKAPPEQVDGWHPDLKKKEEEPISTKEYIKIKEVDLIKNYRMRGDAVKNFMNTINSINSYLTRNPSALIHAQQRYPKSDPHLAALNYKLDMQIAASDEYMEKNFPENTRLYNKLIQATQRSIKLTDPKTFKDKKGKLTSYKKLMRVNYVMTEYDPQDKEVKNRKIKSNKKSAGRFFRKPKKKTRDELLKDKMKVLDKEMLKTMPDY